MILIYILLGWLIGFLVLWLWTFWDYDGEVEITLYLHFELWPLVYVRRGECLRWAVLPLFLLEANAVVPPRVAGPGGGRRARVGLGLEDALGSV